MELGGQVSRAAAAKAGAGQRDRVDEGAARAEGF